MTAKIMKKKKCEPINKTPGTERLRKVSKKSFVLLTLIFRLRMNNKRLLSSIFNKSLLIINLISIFNVQF